MSSTADTNAPKLSKLTIPTTIDLSSGIAALTIAGEASDDMSGVKNFQIWFDKSFTYSFSLAGGQTQKYNFLLNSGTTDSWSDGFSSETWGIAATNPPGTYNVTHVVIEDQQGNSRSYSPAELAAMGVNTSINFINSTVDVIPPQLTSLSIPNIVDLSSGEAGLAIAAQVSDDISGVKNISIRFDKDFTYSFTLGDNSNSKYDFLINSGVYDSWSDGASTQTWGVAATNTSGTYNITQVTVQDMQGNIRAYTPEELAELGANTSIQFINSTPDVTPPQLKSLIIPDVVDLYSKGAPLTIAGSASDDAAGVKNITVWFDKNFTYSFSISDNSNVNYNFLTNSGIDDSWSDGSSSQTWNIAKTNSSGIYNVTKVTVQDLQGNTQTYSSSELAALGINTSVRMVASKHVMTSSDDYFAGTIYADWVLGGNGNDRLNGLAGDDLLDGGDGNDILDGGDGADTMIGGMGNDTYYVDNVNDVVSETSANGGIDTVISSVTRTLGANQENLVLTGTAELNGYGNNLDNKLTGNSAANVLNGGAGADTMIGGMGNDTYYVDNVNDVVSETSANGGIDTVISSVARTLGANQENLVLTGTAELNGYGNNLDNKLTGNSAANVLNGGVGADTMIGGMGNDTYYVDNVNDVVSETSANGGIDTVVASVNWTLGSNQENLVLNGGSDINGYGNQLANKITGNYADNVLDGGAGDDRIWGGDGNDHLIGGSGRDTLTGGAGNDIFYYKAVSDTGITSQTWDVITDFVHGIDKIDLSMLDADAATVANDAFHTIITSDSAFTAAGQLKLTNGVLYGNMNSDSTPEFAIQLSGAAIMELSDFVL